MGRIRPKKEIGKSGARRVRECLDKNLLGGKDAKEERRIKFCFQRKKPVGCWYWPSPGENKVERESGPAS